MAVSFIYTYQQSWLCLLRALLEGYNEAMELLGCRPQLNSRLFSIVSDELECFEDHFTVETRLVRTLMSHKEGYTCCTRADEMTSPSICLLKKKQLLVDDLG